MKKVTIETILSILCFLAIWAIAITLFIYNFHNPSQQVSFQANSLLMGKLDMIPYPDATEHKGKFYWGQGPFPSFLLVPLKALFGDFFNQSYTYLILVPILFFTLYKLARTFNYNRLTSLYFTHAFLFGSMVYHIIISPNSVHFTQIVALVFLAGLIILTEKKYHPVILGIFTGIILATRPTAAVFGLYVLYKYFSQKASLLKYVYYFLPIIVIVIAYMQYNFLRFDDYFDTGYANAAVGQIAGLREKGVFNPINIPTNFYWYFLPSFQPILDDVGRLKFPFITFNYNGLSFILVAPVFLYTLKKIPKKNKNVTVLWITSGVALFGLLSFYNSGWVQFGPRYMADVLPVLYLILLYKFKDEALTYRQQLVCLFSCALNSYILFTHYYYIMHLY